MVKENQLVKEKSVVGTDKKKGCYLQVVKDNQVVHKGSKVIEGECDTLADFNIFPGDMLWVTDSEIHEYRDIAGKFLFEFFLFTPLVA